MDTQMVKLLKTIQKADGKMFYYELCHNPLHENTLHKLRNHNYIFLKPISACASPTPETNIFITAEGRNYLLGQRALAVKENIQKFLVPIVIGVLSGVLSYIASKLIDLWLF